MPISKKQPALFMLREQRWSIAQCAVKIDVPYTHLRNTLHGHVRPRQRVREELPRLLGVELASLFEDRMLAAPNLHELSESAGEQR